MKHKTLIGMIAAGMMLVGTSHPAFASTRVVGYIECDGGGDDKKEKKDKEEKKEDGQESAKVRFKPHQAARLSAKDARKNLRWKEQAITGRAKTRNYFHKTFNTKFGRHVNFRNKFTRNRWRKGRI